MRKITDQELGAMKIAELRALAEELHMEGAQELKKPVLRKAIHDFLQSPEKIGRAHV